MVSNLYALYLFDAYEKVLLIFDTCISEYIGRYFNEFFIYEDVFFMMRLDEVLEIVLDELKDDVLH